MLGGSTAKRELLHKRLFSILYIRSNVCASAKFNYCTYVCQVQFEYYQVVSANTCHTYLSRCGHDSGSDVAGVQEGDALSTEP